MSKRNTVQLNVTEQEQQQFELIAQEQGFNWGDRGNQTALYKAIAYREVQVSKPADLNNKRATEILELITNKVPFHLSYVDAAGRFFTFTARYAEVVYREKRHYLECWCDQTENNQDIPGLQHNWSLRIDRIPEEDSAVVPLDSATWREGLEVLPVQFELYGWLAHAYVLQPNDRLDYWDKKTKVITRQITSTFWFIREVIQYGKNCKILSQSGVRERLIDQLEGAIAHYRP